MTKETGKFHNLSPTNYRPKRGASKKPSPNIGEH